MGERRIGKLWELGQVGSSVYLKNWYPVECKCGRILYAPEETYHCTIEDRDMCFECAAKDEVLTPSVCRWCSARGWW